MGGEGNKKRKEQGSLEKVVQKKTKMAEMVAQSSSSKDVTPVGLNLSQQLILELQVIHCTLHMIHMTLKGVSSQINLDWLEKEKKESSSEEEEEGEENPAEEMMLDEEVMELEEEAKEKAQEIKKDNNFFLYIKIIICKSDSETKVCDSE